MDLSSDRLPTELKNKLEKLSPFAKRYAEFRSKGLSQSDAAKKAGSEATSKDNLGRVGWNTEQMDGVKEYIVWLEMKRAKACAIDDMEIVSKLRAVYESAMLDGKYADANKALELLGNMIGAFALKNGQGTVSTDKQDGSKIKNNVNAFKEDLDPSEDELSDKMKRLRSLMQKVPMK